MLLKPKMETSVLLDRLVSENCLLLGKKSLEKKNNEKNHFVFGGRGDIEILNKTKIKFLLYKLYPLISGFYRTKLKNDDVKFFFASTNTLYSKIIANAAIQCGMPYYTGRWLCGSIAGIIQNGGLNRVFNVKKTREESYIEFFYQKKFKQAVDIKKNQFAAKNRWASLAIIPDVQNNAMILRELENAYIPTTGIINTNSTHTVTYPVFGNDSSLHSVSFFCNLLSKIISSEKSLFSLKKKYQQQLGHKKRNSKSNLIIVKHNGGYFISRRKKKNYKAFWKYLRTYIFPDKRNPRYIKKIVRKKLNIKKYYKKKIMEMRSKIKVQNKKNKLLGKNKKCKKKIIIQNPKNVAILEKNSIKPFSFFTKKDFVTSLFLSKKKSNLRRLFKSFILLKSQNTLKAWPNKNSWLLTDNTLPRYLPISKKLFLKFKKIKKRKFKNGSKLFKKKQIAINAIVKNFKKTNLRSQVLFKKLGAFEKNVLKKIGGFIVKCKKNTVKKTQYFLGFRKNIIIGRLKYFFFTYIKYLRQKKHREFLKFFVSDKKYMKSFQTACRFFKTYQKRKTKINFVKFRKKNK